MRSAQPVSNHSSRKTTSSYCGVRTTFISDASMTGFLWVSKERHEVARRAQRVRLDDSDGDGYMIRYSDLGLV